MGTGGIEDCVRLLEDFRTRFATGSDRLRLSEPYDPYDRRTYETTEVDGSGGCGVYIFADPGGQVRYIGSTRRSLGHRVWSHFGKAICSGERVAFPHKDGKAPADGGRIYTIPTGTRSEPGGVWFLAPALEAYLVGIVRPPANENTYEGF